MDLLLFLDDERWDAPFFKKLSKTDTAGGRSKQGGPGIPSELTKFFPSLDVSKLSASSPVAERYLRVELFSSKGFLGSKIARYQIQTRGNTRNPEARITQIAPLYKISRPGDYLVIQRSRTELDYFRLTLVQAGDTWYNDVASLVTSRTEDVLFTDRIPLAEEDFNVASERLLKKVQSSFEILPEHQIQRSKKDRERIIRDTAFRETLISLYGGCCAVSGCGLRTNDGLLEVQAAHVIPLGLGGPDDPRNGIVLTSTLHWAFDKGLFTFTHDRKFCISPRIAHVDENRFLLQFQGVRIKEPKNLEFKIEQRAIEWHRNYVNHW